MNYLQLCQAVLRESGVSGAGPATVVSQTGMHGRIVGWVADAWREIQTLPYQWTFLWRVASSALVVGKRQYLPAELDMPDMATISRVLVVVNGQRHELERFPPDCRARLLDSQAVGAPQAFLQLPDTGALLLDTSPDAAYAVEVEYHRQPQALTSNLDVPLSPEQYHDAIIWRAMMWYAAFDDAQTLYQVATQRYDQALTRMVNALAPKLEMAASFYR